MGDMQVGVATIDDKVISLFTHLTILCVCEIFHVLDLIWVLFILSMV
jgi:hypothetical protein